MNVELPSGPLAVVVMGVSGCGKSTVGLELSKRMGVEFIEGDLFHPPENVAKMAAGTPLSDSDRSGWLSVLSEQLRSAQHQQRSVILSCSALKREYRNVLRLGAQQAIFIFLHASADVLNERVSRRKHQYMPASLLDSQLATLEVPAPPELVLPYDVASSVESIVQDIFKKLRRKG
jgi:gluconokinase